MTTTLEEAKRRKMLGEKIDKLPMGEVVTLFHHVRGWVRFEPTFWDAVEGYFKDKEKT